MRIVVLCTLAVVLSVACPISDVHAGSLRVGWQDVDGVQVFYREGGRTDDPTVVFLHGNPASSFQYRDVMTALAGSYHVLAPDYPSFGFSSAPDRATWRYTFDNVTDIVRRFLAAKNVTRYSLFMQDYGVPIGFRLIGSSPEAVQALIVQNGVIHLDGFPAAQDANGELRQHWLKRNEDLDRRRREFTRGMRFPAAAGWDASWNQDLILLNMSSAQRPGVIDARNDLWFDYGSNIARYPEWQALLRKLDVPLLVLWGGRDEYFTVPGALAYRRDAPHAEVHILDADHFATVEVPDEIVRLAAPFLARHLRGSSAKGTTAEKPAVGETPNAQKPAAAQ